MTSFLLGDPHESDMTSRIIFLAIKKQPQRTMLLLSLKKNSLRDNNNIIYCGGFPCQTQINISLTIFLLTLRCFVFYCIYFNFIQFCYFFKNKNKF
jgi:hypothetical protein